MIRRSLPLAVALTLVSGCMVPSGTTPAGDGVKRPSPVQPGIAPNVDGASLISDKGAGLISDKGAGLITNNGGGLIGKVKIPTGLIANSGGSLISDKGAGAIVSAAGSGLIGKVKYQTLAVDEQPASGFVVSIVDAEGKLIPDAEGQPYRTTTQPDGSYEFKQTPRGLHLVVRVELPEAVGPMLAYLPSAEAGASRRADVGGVSTLVMGYILDRYVKGDLDVLQKLPPAAEAETRAKAEAALAAAPSSFKAPELVKTVEAMRAKDAAFDTQVKYVESLLVAGLKDVGEGLEATKVALTNPTELLFMPDGSLLVVERNGHRLRRVKDGKITTYAGKDGAQALGDGGPAVEAFLDRPNGAAVDREGNVYVADFGHERLRRIDAKTGLITTVAGIGRTGVAAASGVKATEAHLGLVKKVVIDRNGLPVFACSAGVFRLKPDGLLQKLPVAGSSVLAYTPNGELITHDGDTGMFQRLAADETPMASGLPTKKGVVNDAIHVASDGTVWFSADRQLFKLVNGAWEEYAPAMALNLSAADGMFQKGQDLFLCDSGAGRIWRLPLGGGSPELLAGLPAQLADGVKPEELSLNRPTAVMFDARGQFYVADGWNGVVWQQRADGLYYRYAGSTRANADTTEIGDGGPARDAKLGNIGGVAFTADGRMLIADSPFPLFRIREVATNGTIKTMTPPSGALAAPFTMAVEADGGVLFSDYLLKKVVRIKDGVASDAVPAGKLALPGGLATSADGSFFVADTNASAVHRVAKDGTMTLLAGAGEGFSGDGGPAAAARLNHPLMLALDGKGALYISDSRNDRVRRVDLASGVITTVAGAGSAVQAGTTVEDSLKEPMGLAFDAEGNMFIADSGHNQVKKVPASALR